MRTSRRTDSIGAAHFVREYRPTVERLHRAVIAVEECREGTDLRQARLIVAANAAWVAASFLLLVTNALPLTTAGAWIVMIQADAVLVIIIAEIVAIRRLNKQ